MSPERDRADRGSASIWAVLVIASSFTLLLGLVVDGGILIDTRVTSAHAAAQAARVGADSLSAAGVRNGHDVVANSAAITRAVAYLHDAGMTGSVDVRGDTVSVTVTGRSPTRILSIIGITSFPVDETQTATAVTEESSP